MPTKCNGSKSGAILWPIRVFAILAAIGLSAGAWANAAFYTGSNAADLNAPTGSTVTFNTDTGVLTLGGGATAPGFSSTPPQSEDVAGVRVFRFRNVTIATGVNITVTGSKPLSVTANGDMYVSSGFDVSGSVPGRAGGGIGGTGGTGGGGGGGGHDGPLPELFATPAPADGSGAAGTAGGRRSGIP